MYTEVFAEENKIEVGICLNTQPLSRAQLMISHLL